jgi:hypothetical protein
MADEDADEAEASGAAGAPDTVIPQAEAEVLVEEAVLIREEQQ